MRVRLAAHLYSRPMLYRLLRFEYFRFALTIGFYKQDSKGLTMYPAKKRELRHDRHTVSLLTDHLVITPKYRGKIKGRSSRILRQEFPHLKDWCGDHLWAPGCYHGSVGQGWEVVEKYISSQNCAAGQEGL